MSKIFNYNTFRFVKEDGEIGKKIKQGAVTISVIVQVMLRLKNENKKDSNLFKELQEFLKEKKNKKIYDNHIKASNLDERNSDYYKKLVIFKPSNDSNKMWNDMMTRWKEREHIHDW